MEHRKPYQMKTFMVVYNLYQLAACFYLIHLILSDEDVPMSRIFSNCLKVKSLNTSPALYHLTAFSFWLKASEMCETMVFILRKKYNQVSFLHVFHHCATVTLIFLGGHSGHSKYSTIKMKFWYRYSISVRGAYLALFINSIVHVIMYSYYLAAAVMSNKVVSKLTPIKKSITTIQMIQFTIILLHIFIQRFYFKCYYNDYVLAVFTVFVGIIFYSFYDFYQKSYNSSKKSHRHSKTVRSHWVGQSC